jgi:hypothetical protein
MKSFLKEFLRDQPAGAGAARQIFLGAFGKHPGWNDHMDDIGLETESLVAAKKHLYIDGAGGQISSGAWEKLDEYQQIPFRHVFIWSRAPQLLVGKLWASQDGKGRSLYPMMVCAHTVGVPLEIALQGILPCLEHIHETSVATKSAGEVLAIMKHFRDALRGWIVEVGEAQVTTDVAAFLSQIEFATANGGLSRVLAAVRAGVCGARSSDPAKHFRLPASAASPELSLGFWEHFLATQIDPATPLFLAMPEGQYWVDAIVGEPTPADLYCLRCSPRVIPLSNDSQVEVTPALVAETESLLDHLKAGTSPGAERKSWISRLFRSERGRCS